MSEFSLSSNYFTNVTSIASKLTAYSDLKFSIVVNDFFIIEIPQIVAAYISSVVTQLLEADQTTSELRINIKSNTDIRSSLEKIRRCIATHEKVTLEDEDIPIFGEFGLLIGNEDFSRPMNKKFELDSKFLSVENVISVITLKEKFSIADISKETAFIADNFESMKSNERFISFCSDENNINTIEEILGSNELKLYSEDSLVSFIINICRLNDSNDTFLLLFDKVLFQYCSVECCEEFINFVNEIVESPGVRSLISCMGRRCVQSTLPVKPDFIKYRHIKQFPEITNENPMNGILRREHKKGNVLMEQSSTNGCIAYNTIDDDESNYFQSKNIQNSYIQASFKDQKMFVIKSYMLKGGVFHGGFDPKNWILEGQRLSDGNWIKLDEQNDNQLIDDDPHVFNVFCNEKLKAVRLTQKGANCHISGNYYRFTVKSFDVFGSLYE